MTLILEEDIIAIMPRAKLKAAQYVDALNEAFEEYGINTPLRIAGFMSQIAVESGELRFTKELWGPTAQQLKYENWDRLGNNQPGDGKKFMGRGLIQVTGRANYEACGDALGLDLLNEPELLEKPEWAVKSAAWYWKTRGLNELADEGDVRGMTRRINGGLTHLDERQKYYDKAVEVLYV